MYKIIFKNPSDETKKIQKKISESDLKRIRKAKRDKTDFEIIGYGGIPHYNIVFYGKDNPEYKSLPEPQTAYESNPPTIEEEKKLRMGVLYNFEGNLVCSSEFFNAIIKSVWNWQSEKTKELMSVGESLQKQGYSFSSLFKELNVK